PGRTPAGHRDSRLRGGQNRQGGTRAIYQRADALPGRTHDGRRYTHYAHHTLTNTLFYAFLKLSQEYPAIGGPRVFRALLATFARPVNRERRLLAPSHHR